MKSLNLTELTKIHGGSACNYTMGFIYGMGVVTLFGPLAPMGVVLLATGGALSALGACAE